MCVPGWGEYKWSSELAGAVSRVGLVELTARDGLGAVQVVGSRRQVWGVGPPF